MSDLPGSTKGKLERFNGYLRRSFYVPQAAAPEEHALAVYDQLLTNVTQGVVT